MESFPLCFFVDIDVSNFDFDSSSTRIFTNNANLTQNDFVIETIITEQGDKTMLVVKNLSIENAIIHLHNQDSAEYTFVYINKKETSKQVSDVFDLISILHNFTDTSILSVRLSSESSYIDEYVSLTYSQNNGYELNIIKESSEGYNFNLEIYYSFMDNLTNEVKEIVYYSKNFVVEV